MGSRSSKKIVRVKNLAVKENQKARFFPPATLGRVTRSPAKTVILATRTLVRGSSLRQADRRAARIESVAPGSPRVVARRGRSRQRPARGTRMGRKGATILADGRSARCTLQAWAVANAGPPPGGLARAVGGLSPRPVRRAASEDRPRANPSESIGVDFRESAGEPEAWCH